MVSPTSAPTGSPTSARHSTSPVSRWGPASSRWSQAAVRSPSSSPPRERATSSPALTVPRPSWAAVTTSSRSPPALRKRRNWPPRRRSDLIFIATPGAGNIQPRFDGAKAVLGSSYHIFEVTTGATEAPELAAEKAFLAGHKTIKGAFAVDAGSTEVLGQALSSSGLKIPNGGFDTTPTTLANLQSGLTNFTIYQDPYLQGFLPTLQMYMYNLSGGTLSPSDTDTGLTFITKSNAVPFTKSSRYQGSTTAQKNGL